MAAKRMSAGELDELATRIEQLELEVAGLRSQVQEQVEQYGSTPPRAEKSKRLLGEIYQFTMSWGESIEIKDAEVERIKGLCKPSIFKELFRETRSYRLAKGALQFLASPLPEGAPRNLRMLFDQAFNVKARKPTLRIAKISGEEEQAEAC